MKLQLTGLVCVMSVLSLSACGSDASPAANGGNAGSGGGGAKSGLACGSANCQAPAGFTGELCCHDSFSSICGEATMADLCTAFPPQRDAMCPDGTVVQSVGSMLVRGCCIDGTNQCGLDLTGGAFGSGTACSTLDDAKAFSSFSSGPAGSTATTNIPPPTNCDGTPSM